MSPIQGVSILSKQKCSICLLLDFKGFNFFRISSNMNRVFVRSVRILVEQINVEATEILD